MKRELIAQVAHEINRAYCASQGDESQPAWADAPEWQQSSALAGVDMHLANPDATPEQSHESWLEVKRAEGWSYGDEKDVERKLHPCFVPYDQLPVEQKAKDYLFRAVVHALKAIPDVAPRVVPPQVVNAVGGKVPVRYIGKRESYTDGTYGTRIVFSQGKTRLVPADKAALMLTHADVYEPGSLDDVADEEQALDPEADAQAEDKRKAEEQEERDQAMRDSVSTMNRKSLASFAKTNFNVDLDPNGEVGEMRSRVIGLLDQFGAP